MENIVEISGLTKDYETGFWRKKKVRALEGLTLSVKPGQIFGFLGGNGAGKTTTIKILMGLIFPSAGTAKILGRDITDVGIHSSIGYCPENPYFYDYLTATELMEYFGAILGLPSNRRKERSDELLSRVGIEPADRKKQLRKFSKGMLQRVGLAQALINDPEIVFLDEPMSGLDPIGRRDVRQLIAGLRETGTTVFMSTHILSDVEALCDEVAILRKGKLAATGKLDELLSNGSGKQVFEITVSGISVEDVNSELNDADGTEILASPSGVILRTGNESEIESLLRICRNAGGHLVSVQPTRRSLEELFVQETA